MLAACRLAGLSALILDYASRLAVAQRSATVAAETAAGTGSGRSRDGRWLASRLQPRRSTARWQKRLQRRL